MSATITNIQYGMKGSTLRSLLNANKESIFNYTRDESSGIADFTEGITYTQFIAKLNSVFALAPEKFYTTNDCETLTITSTDLPTKVNTNFNVLKEQGDIFLNDGVPYFLNKKTLTIPSKGTANILCQNGKYKLAYYTGENTLYLSDDNGLTWGYSGTLAVSPTLLRLCHLFSDGSVLMGVIGNRLFSSQDKLQHINEIYCRETNGDIMQFHVPKNASYPGSYYSIFKTDSYVIGDKEVMIFGVYMSHDDYGATPRLLYATTDKGATVKVVYRFGSYWEGEQYDNGTALGAFEDGANALGDPGSEIKIHHVHSARYNADKGKFIIMTGDGGVQIYFIEATYDSQNDSFSFKFNQMPAGVDDAFRAVGMSFFNSGNNVIWSSDGNGRIYKVPYSDLTKTIDYHTPVYYHQADDLPDLMDISTYGEVMMSIVGSTTPAVVGSVDYGDTWVLTPANYSTYIDSSAPALLIRMWEKDELGYYLVHKINSFVGIPLNATRSMLLEIKKKPVRS